MSGKSAAVNPADHVGLLWSTVYRLRRRGERDDELASDAALGLISACRLYDPAAGAVSTYATRAMTWSILGGRRSERLYRRPSVGPGRLRKGQRAPRVSLVLFSEMGQDFYRGRHEAFGRPDPTPGWEAAEAAEALAGVARRVTAVLSGRYAEVLRLRSVDGLTYEAIGDRLGVTRERVRQIYELAVYRVREAAAGRAKKFCEDNPLPPATADDRRSGGERPH